MSASPITGHIEHTLSQPMLRVCLHDEPLPCPACADYWPTLGECCADLGDRGPKAPEGWNYPDDVLSEVPM